MLKKIILGLAAAIGIFLIYVALQPADYIISREVQIQAAPEAIFPRLNSARKANEWMPWTEQDPHLQMKYSGPEEGVGSATSWESPGQMGNGRSEVVESVPNQLVKTKLTYTKPFEMSQMAEMSITPVNGGSLVKWSVTGKNHFIARIFCTFMNMDDMVGKEFQKGLNKLKAQSE